MAVESCELTIGSETDAIAPVLAQLEFSESIDELDALTVWLDIPAGYPDRTKLAKAIKVGETFELKFADRTVEGDIVRIRWKYLAGGAGTWIIEGLEPLHRIRGLQLSELSELKLDKIVETLMKKGPKSVAVTGVKATAKELVMLDDSALKHIKRIASERNWSFFTDSKGKVNFGPRNTKGAAVSVYFSDLDVADVTADLLGMPSTVEARGYDYRKDDSTNADLKFLADKTKCEGITGDDTGPSLRPSTWGTLAIALEQRFSAIDLKELEERAIGTLQRAAEQFVTGEVVTGLTAGAMPTTELTIEGAPWPFTGPYRVRSACHTFGPGAGSETRIEFFSDSLPALT